MNQDLSEKLVWLINESESIKRKGALSVKDRERLQEIHDEIVEIRDILKEMFPHANKTIH